PEAPRPRPDWPGWRGSSGCGRINITSKPGHGSVFTMSLPLTLAVLDGMVVTVAGQTMVVPLTAIVETLQPEAAAI
ncbi:hypothetical protein, partial [Rhizobium leguminosarum]|uniref:hypothetical protein n=1 Tax=Rhizobium leguminosarum TaxID=384 RepID=UPI003F999CBD